jgi:carbamoyl-phosphate synthase large subunit
MGVGEIVRRGVREEPARCRRQAAAVGPRVHQRQERDKRASSSVEMLADLGFELVATRGTAAALTAAGVPVATVNKVAEGRPHIVDMLVNDEIDSSSTPSRKSAPRSRTAT